jgi:dihydrofolate reductase
MTALSIIVAFDMDRAIGRANGLPWHIPRDLKNFRQVTTGKPIIMGRKTYQSIGRPLPHRINIVVTRDRNFSAPGTHAAPSVEAAVGVARALGGTTDSRDIMVIGGAQIFAQVLPDAARIYMTRVLTRIPDADAWFPDYDEADWKISAREIWEPDSATAWECEYRVLERLRRDPG